MKVAASLAVASLALILLQIGGQGTRAGGGRGGWRGLLAVVVRGHGWLTENARRTGMFS